MRRPRRPNPRHRRFVRRNPDEKLRQLERAAAGGDQDALVNLIAYRVQRNLIADMPQDQKILLRRAVVDSLDPGIRQLEEIGDRARWHHTPDYWGWFPLHSNNLKCPRGHRDSGGSAFWITNGATIEYPTYINDHGAFLDYDAEDLTGQVVALACGSCRAHWPLTGDVGVNWIEDGE